MDDKEYNRKYYQKNRKKLLEKRRQKYKADPKYREAIKEKATIRKKLVAMERRLHKHGPTIPFGGGMEAAYTLHGIRTKVVRVSWVFLYNWRNRGILPEALFHDPKKPHVAWYSKSQTMLIKTVIDLIRKESLPLTYADVTDVLGKFWNLTFDASEVVAYAKRKAKDHEGSKLNKVSKG